MLRVVLAGEPVASLSESLSTIAFMCGYVGHPAAVAYRILRNDSDSLSINEGRGRAQTRHRRAQVTLFGAPGYHLVQPSNGHRRPERWPRTGSATSLGGRVYSRTFDSLASRYLLLGGTRSGMHACRLRPVYDVQRTFNFQLGQVVLSP